MERQKRRFPLVADDEIIVEPVKVMQLYDNEDLINNIHGPYQDRDYPDVIQSYHFVAEELPKKINLSLARDDKSYAQQQKEEARKVVKKRRQDYIVSKIQPPSHPSLKTSGLGQKVPTKSQVKSPTDLSRFSANLVQTSYILAELPKQYQVPNNVKTSKTANQNYDFLKKSQIYNYPENQRNTTYKRAQELNLTFSGRAQEQEER